jgi:hypothetical protein
MLLSQDENTDPLVVEFTLHALPDQRTWFAVTAYDATDESGYSNEVCTNLCAPGGLIIVGGNQCKADFDCDGDVDGADLAVVSNEFGRTDCMVE